jgi:hypothetical protein
MIAACAGDAGDLIFLLGILQELPGGPHTLLLEKSELTTLKTDVAVRRLHGLLNRLVIAQPYIKEFRSATPDDKIEWHSGSFREGSHHVPTNTLQNAHLSHLRTILRTAPARVGHRPWISIKPSKDSAGKILINRTERYNNPFFPWKQVVDFYGASNILFAGTELEHLKFTEKFGNVPHYETQDFYEVAALIAGSSLFIGNQSCANAICEGLKHTSIQETSLIIPDCIFSRDNAQHVGDGACTLPCLKGGKPLVLPAIRPPSSVNTNSVPNGGWQIDGALMGRSWSMALRATQARFGMDEAAAKNLLLDKQAERLPVKFARASAISFAYFNKALTAAREG